MRVPAPSPEGQAHACRHPYSSGGRRRLAGELGVAAVPVDVLASGDEHCAAIAVPTPGRSNSRSGADGRTRPADQVRPGVVKVGDLPVQCGDALGEEAAQAELGRLGRFVQAGRDAAAVLWW